MTDRFSATIMCNGLGEFEYIKIKDRRYSDNHLTYHISSDRDLDYLLNSLNELKRMILTEDWLIMTHKTNSYHWKYNDLFL